MQEEFTIIENNNLKKEIIKMKKKIQILESRITYIIKNIKEKENIINKKEIDDEIIDEILYNTVFQFSNYI